MQNAFTHLPGPRADKVSPGEDAAPSSSALGRGAVSLGLWGRHCGHCGEQVVRLRGSEPDFV